MHEAEKAKYRKKRDKCAEVAKAVRADAIKNNRYKKEKTITAKDVKDEAQTSTSNNNSSSDSTSYNNGTSKKSNEFNSNLSDQGHNNVAGNNEYELLNYGKDDISPMYEDNSNSSTKIYNHDDTALTFKWGLQFELQVGGLLFGVEVIWYNKGNMGGQYEDDQPYVYIGAGASPPSSKLVL